MSATLRNRSLMIAGLAAILLGAGYACSPKQGPATLTSGDAAQKVYVAPGSYDEFYAFMSGGFSGQVAVYGLPSGRLLKVIPVFSQFPENGYGYNEETKPMLKTTYGFIPWDDSHHPELSQTNGVRRRPLAVHQRQQHAAHRAHRSRRRFETDEIIEIPNAGGNHASPFITPNTKYVVASARASACRSRNADVPIAELQEELQGHDLVHQGRTSRARWTIAFQILMPGFNYDLGARRQGPVRRTGSSSRRTTPSRRTRSSKMNASQNDKDFIAAVNWQAGRGVRRGRQGEAGRRRSTTTTVMDDVTRIARVRDEDERQDDQIRRDCPGSIYYLPTPKSPHGVDVDPTGEYIVAGGKLATVIPVHSFTKMQKAIADKAFEGEIDGIPVLKYDAVIAGEVQKPGPRPAAHRVRRQGLRLHLDVHLVGDREVEARHVGSRRPHPDLLLDRPPDDSRRRHARSRGASTSSR